jgi:hypothetical protein
VFFSQPGDHWRQAEVRGGEGAREHPAQNQAGRTALTESIAAEPAQAVGGEGEVGLAGSLVLFEALRRQDHLDEVFALLVPNRGERRHPEIAVHPGPRRRTHLDVQVGRALLDYVSKDGR